MKKQHTTEILNSLLAVFLNNFIFYIPNEILFDGVIEQLEGEIPDNLFNELSFLEIDTGIAMVTNEDAITVNEKLFEKKLQLEDNLFKLLAIKKEITETEFQIIIEKYVEQLYFLNFITDWLTKNLKIYNEPDIHLSIVGAFNLQQQNFNIHLNDLFAHLGDILVNEKEHYFSAKSLATYYFPNLISIYAGLSQKYTEQVDALIIQTDNHVTETKATTKPLQQTKKRQRPELCDKKIEQMILERIFKVKVTKD